MSNAACRACGDRDVYVTRVSSGGGYAPQLLPGLKRKWSESTTLEIAVCAACGHVEFTVPPEFRAQLPTAKKWRRRT